MTGNGRWLHGALVFSALSLGLLLGGCESLQNWDPTDVFAAFETKKKLPGERKPVFPEGTPGVPQGMPAELVKGYQPPAEPAPPPPAQAAVAEPEKPKPKPKPKPKVVARPDDPSRPAAVSVRPGPTAAPQQATAPWPEPAQAQRQQQSQWPGDAPQAQRQQSPWPDQPRQQQQQGGTAPWPGQ